MKKKTKVKLEIPTTLLIVFIVLKATSVVTWPWVWVLSPLWFPIGLHILYLLTTYALDKLNIDYEK